MVHDQLRQLLLEHDCVTLPGFGALLAEPVPARIHPVRHTLSPPARRVAFSDRLRHDDGLLTAAVRRALTGAEAEEAPARVRSFTEELRAALRQHRAAELRGLGTLRQLTDGDPIRFDALEPGYLPLASSFGLPELVSRPVVPADRSRATRYVPETAPATGPQLRPVPSRLRRLVGEGAEPLYRLATAAVVVLSLTATYFNFQLTPLANRYLVQPANSALTTTAPPAAEPQRAAVATADVAPESTPAPTAATSEDAAWAAHTQAGSVAPHKKAPSPDALGTVAMAAPAPKPAAQPLAIAARKPVTVAALKAKPVAVSTPAAAPAEAMRRAPTNRYYLIWNAFTTPAKAAKGRQQVLALSPPDAGNAPSVLAPPRGSALYRVAVADFATAEEAQAAKPALRARYGPALWVLRY